MPILHCCHRMIKTSSVGDSKCCPQHFCMRTAHARMKLDNEAKKGARVKMEKKQPVHTAIRRTSLLPSTVNELTDKLTHSPLCTIHGSYTIVHYPWLLHHRVSIAPTPLCTVHGSYTIMHYPWLQHHCALSMAPTPLCTPTP